MNLNNEKYIILEIIPTSANRKKGNIAQLSALKLNGLILEDRFDYRLEKEKISNSDVLNIINYDNVNFKYVDSTKVILSNFKKFIGDFPLLIIDNVYTNNYLEEFKNSKESVFKYLNLSLSVNVFDELIKKYELEPSNHLVDLLYEALIKSLD